MMNPTENIGAVLKYKVDELTTNEDRRDRYNYDILRINLENTLKDLEDDAELFTDLLCSIRKRFDGLETAREGHTTQVK